MAQLTRSDLEKIKAKHTGGNRSWIKVGFSTCGIAAGAQDVYDALVEEVRKHNVDVEVKKCGCVGMCSAEPLVEVCVKDMPRVFYGKVDKETAIRIVEKHVCGKMLVNDRIYDLKFN